MSKTKEKLYRWIAYKTPKTLRYFIVIDAWAKATTGEYSHREATSLTAEEMIKAIEPHPIKSNKK